MSGRKKTYIISGSIIVVLVTILSILAVQYILPNSMSIWKGESISSYGGIWSVEMTTEVQNQKTPETVGLDMDFTNRKGTLKLFGLIPVKQVNVEVWEHTELIP